MAKQELICAWCHPGVEAHSHGICVSCLQEQLDGLRAERAAAELVDAPPRYLVRPRTSMLAYAHTKSLAEARNLRDECRRLIGPSLIYDTEKGTEL